MEIIAKTMARRGGEHTDPRWYYDAEHVRLVETHLPSKHVQNPHSHAELYDITFVLEGEIVAIEAGGDGSVREQTLGPGDLVVFGPGRDHNVVNRGDEMARTITLKFVRPEGLTREEFLAKCTHDWHAAKDWPAPETR